MRSPNPAQLVLAAAIAASATAPPALAQVVAGWEHEAASGVQFAFFSAPDRELAVRCKSSAVEVVFYMDQAAFDPAVRSLSKGVFAVSIDDEPELRWIESSIVVDGPVVSLGVGGKAAEDLARDIAAASKSVVVSVLAAPPVPDGLQYNSSPFPAIGAADAIKAAFAGCGIRY